MEISRGRKALFETSEFCNHDKVVSGATSLSQLFSIFVSSPPSVQEMRFPNYVGACTSPVVRPCCTWGCTSPVVRPCCTWGGELVHRVCPKAEPNPGDFKLLLSAYHVLLPSTEK